MKDMTKKKAPRVSIPSKKHPNYMKENIHSTTGKSPMTGKKLSK